MQSSPNKFPAGFPSRRIPQSAAKRMFDMGLAALGLLVSAPLWAAVAGAIVLDDGAPVFFRQARWGRGGRRFMALKFRTMHCDAASEQALQATAHDPRVTRVGCWLRASALDELPQLWNIVQGDVSFVGPRALALNEVQANGPDKALPDEAIAGFWDRLAVRPGLTGVAQIFADRDIPRRHKFRYDLFYVQRQNFWLDLRLIVLSFYIRHYRELFSAPGVLIPSPLMGEGKGGGECQHRRKPDSSPPHPSLPPPGGKGQNRRATRQEIAMETQKTNFR